MSVAPTSDSGDEKPFGFLVSLFAQLFPPKSYRLNGKLKSISTDAHRGGKLSRPCRREATTYASPGAKPWEPPARARGVLSGRANEAGPTTRPAVRTLSRVRFRTRWFVDVFIAQRVPAAPGAVTYAGPGDTLGWTRM